MAPSQNKYTEAELLVMLRQRRQPAFNYLYDNYSAALYTVIVNILNDRERSNDVLQEVFVKIWRQIDSYDETKGRLFTWMMNIARNASIDLLRSRDFRNSLQNRELSENVYEAGGSTELKTEAIGLRKIVASLKEDYRALVELAYFEGYTQDEISKMLNLPLGTVKTRLRAALAQLRGYLKHND